MKADRHDDDPLAHGRMTLWEHLGELRTRLVRCAIAVAVGAVVGWIIFPYVVDFLVAPYRRIDPNAQLYAFDLLAQFTIRLETASYLGIGFAMPVIMWQLWRFVTPGLYPHEKRYAVPFVASSIVLFVLGATLAYLTLPAAISFLLGVGGFEIKQLTGAESYLKFNLFMMLAFGAAFEFPILLVALQMVGILTPRKLLAWWRYAIVVVCITAAVITPSQDPITMAAMALPMMLFYFISVGLGFLLARRKRRSRTES